MQKGAATIVLKDPGIKTSDIAGLIQKHEATLVDFRFTDTMGTFRHVSVPVAAVDDQALLSGVAYGNVLIKPDLSTARVDTTQTTPRIAIVGDLFDPIAKDASPLDPRSIAKRAQDYLRSTNFADAAHFAPETDFFLLSNDDEESGSHGAIENIRSEIARELAGCNIAVESLQAGASPENQTRIAFKSETLVQAADTMTTFKHVAKTIAARSGHVAAFMPKPLNDVEGSGMACRQSLWKDSRPLFFDANGYAECSQTMLYYIGGLLTHIRSLAAFALPSTNSYSRLIPGGQAPVKIAFSSRNGTAAIGIPTLFPGNAKAKRLEFRAADPSATPYLAFSAMLLAGLDGIKRKVDPVRAGFGPLDGAAANAKTLPGSLRESLDALASDHDYLTESGVFSSGFVEHWVATKTANEAHHVALRPHPYEFELYLNC